MAISVGAACSIRSSGHSTQTLVSVDVPANATGTIDSVCVYSDDDMSGIEYAAFAGSWSSLTTNGDTNGSNLSASGQVTHTAAGDDFVAFAIETDERIGIYYSGGRIEADGSGGGNLWAYPGDAIPTAATGFNIKGSDVMSCHGTGTEGNGEEEGIPIPIFMNYYRQLRN